MKLSLMESKFTIELRYLNQDPNFTVFDFNYDFYDDNHKLNFERKFLQHYFFHEIGCESVARWKHMLKNKLDMIAPYYKQLYETELESKGITFLLNKDLKETFIREVTSDTDRNSESEFNVNSNSSDNTNSTSTNNSSSTNTTDFKESNINNGNASLNYDSLTNVNKNNDTSSSSDNSNLKQSSDSSSTSTSSNKNKSLENQTQKESTTLISQGNIGTTSSAELLEKWREVLINIDEMIIKNELRDLFMLVY